MSNRDGLTLIELLTVIGIVAVLMLLSAPPFVSWIKKQKIESKAVQMYTDLKWAQQTAIQQGEYGIQEATDTSGRLITTMLQRKIYFAIDPNNGGYKVIRWQDEDADGVIESGELAPDFRNADNNDAPMKEVQSLSPASIGVPNGLDKVACSNNNKNGQDAIVNIGRCPDVTGDSGEEMLNSNERCIIFNSKGFYEGADNASVYITDDSGKYSYGISINVTGTIRLCRWTGSEWVRLR